MLKYLLCAQRLCGILYCLKQHQIIIISANLSGWGNRERSQSLSLQSWKKFQIFLFVCRTAGDFSDMNLIKHIPCYKHFKSYFWDPNVFPKRSLRNIAFMQPAFSNLVWAKLNYSYKLRGKFTEVNNIDWYLGISVMPCISDSWI